MHGNGMDLDEDNDVIYVSVNGFSEVWVVDHSTTTEEARTNTDGNYNKGGDLLYRFGNPTAYKNSQGDRLFFKNHFPNLLEGNVPGAGNFMIYNNGVRFDGSASRATTLNFGNSNAWIGADVDSFNSNFGNYFNGDIDDVR
ncbi:MAG: hypothetical protein HQ521_03095, partial [Bacteroidetes bacterium]|nr:hypothetical protein [Bacteroidota bacterium]